MLIHIGQGATDSGGQVQLPLVQRQQKRLQKGVDASLQALFGFGMGDIYQKGVQAFRLAPDPLFLTLPVKRGEQIHQDQQMRPQDVRGQVEPVCLAEEVLQVRGRLLRMIGLQETLNFALPQGEAGHGIRAFHIGSVILIAVASLSNLI